MVALKKHRRDHAILVERELDSRRVAENMEMGANSAYMDKMQTAARRRHDQVEAAINEIVTNSKNEVVKTNTL